ncbi:MAG: bifunctional 4-hydroxy-2-oxoglutarate aldolase/2-dehydro-3-deoxy-phosphogluconate aldolase ['Waltheria sp.' little leaf phytoplasma]|nr:bifunctional 4-hydroxy-2-oxoglutarate aldolase/2-dehydro-3-deoxy-phosphogluconate aldolase ['Waltheria sp.' little leaf phytoplasma]
MRNIQKKIYYLKQNPLSVIVRTKTKNNAYKILKNTLENGFRFAEITLTIPQAFSIIKEISLQYPEAMIGAGTVLTLQEAKTALEAGAQYLVSPVYNEEILNWSIQNDILYVPGVMSVNEMYLAIQKGASLLKLYPSIAFTSQALSLIRDPFPNWPILATGGINLLNILDYFEAGALAVGITGELGSDHDVDIVDESKIANLAFKYVDIVKKVIKKRGLKNDK